MCTDEIAFSAMVGDMCGPRDAREQVISATVALEISKAIFNKNNNNSIYL